MSHAQLFTLAIRVYYEDTDAGGVVYHSQYLNFMERARTESLRSLGFEQTALKEQFGVLFVVRSVNLQYKKPARLNDMLQIETILTSVGRSLFTFEQQIKRGDELLNLATVEVVCVDATQFKPISMPPMVKEAMITCVKSV